MRVPQIPFPLVLGLAIIATFFVNLGAIPLFDLDEGAFSEATREMLASGNWAATYLNGVPRYDKPIFSYWMQAISVSSFGLHEWAFRLPSAIASSLWVLATYQFARQFFSLETGRYAALMLCTTLWISIVGRAAIADAWLNLFVALSIFDIWRYAHGSQRRHLLQTYLWLALGLLTKGPVAVLIPLLVSGLYFCGNGQWRWWLKAIFNPFGWLVFVACTSPWLYLVYLDQGLDFFRGFIIDHNLKRFADTREGHGGHWYYYLVLLPVIFSPFASGIINLLAKSKHIFCRASLDTYLGLWFLVVFALVSVSGTQLPHYVLYGATGLVLLFAQHHRSLFTHHWHLLPLAVLVVICAMLPTLIIPKILETQSDLYTLDMLGRFDQAFTNTYWWILSGAICITAAGGFWLRMSSTNSLILAGFCFNLFTSTALLPAVAELQQGPIKQAAELARQLPADRKLVASGINMPSFSVYRGAITPRQAPQAGDIVLTRSDRLPSLLETFNSTSVRPLFHTGGIVLLEIHHEH